MRQHQSNLIIVVAVAALTAPHALLAQRGRGGTPGRAGSPATPPTNRGSSGQAGSPATARRGESSPGMTRLENNAVMSQRVQPLLPPGSDLHSAAAGFRNEGEFLAALHASRSLGIPFDQLKSQMTQRGGGSLGEAIHAVRPEMDKKAVKDSVKVAHRMATEDVRAAKADRMENAVASEIRSHVKLSERLTPLLPPGMTFDQAASGFRNTGQFVAALHVAKNLGIPFRDLRARMIAGGESLGEAIRDLRPEMRAPEIESAVNAAAQASGRDLQAREDVHTSASVRK